MTLKRVLEALAPRSGDTTPCRMTGMTLHGVVSPKGAGEDPDCCRDFELGGWSGTTRSSASCARERYPSRTSIGP